MSDQSDGLFAIEVDADHYAQTAAGDTPIVSRTYQSEADFEAQKASYTAKIDGGKTYQDLIKAVPALNSSSNDEGNVENGHAKVKLSKKDVQLLGYAVGELYYDKDYLRLIELCDRVQSVCQADQKMAESLKRWRRRCRERMAL